MLFNRATPAAMRSAFGVRQKGRSEWNQGTGWYEYCNDRNENQWVSLSFWTNKDITLNLR